MEELKEGDAKLPPVRLFEEDFFEFFTHTQPWVVLLIWVPVVMWNISSVIKMGKEHPLSDLLSMKTVGELIIGYLMWSFTEYNLHRFVFHYQAAPDQILLKNILFKLHGAHHYQPNCKTRTLTPPAVSIPLGVIMRLVFGYAFNSPQIIFAGFLSGYIVYDMMHYSIHQFEMTEWPWNIFREFKESHLKHHQGSKNMIFGVSSSTWDLVFATKYPTNPLKK